LLVETIASTLKLPYAAITLRAIELAGEQGRLSGAATGTAVAEMVELPLRYQNETVGYLVVSPRSPGESFTDRERQLLADIAGQAGATAYSVRLTAALQRSREKMVLAREEERRRIRRDLHDELGPTLASQTFALDTALELLETDPRAATRLLQALKSQNQETVADIRRLVHELRPPALDELGLVGALQAQAGRLESRNALQIDIISEPGPPPPLPAAVEVAAYRIALEAMTNVVRHAEAEKCTVRLRIADFGFRNEGQIRNLESKTRAEPGRSIPNQLIIAVTDDGIGLPTQFEAGVGLNSMRERAEELGGSFQTRPGEKGGTRVTAVLPL
jgi:signal transduction histidine kinase